MLCSLRSAPSSRLLSTFKNYRLLSSSKKSSSGNRVWIVGVSLVVAVPLMYLGAAHYSQEDRDFKKYFRSYVPGGDYALKSYKYIKSITFPKKIKTDIDWKEFEEKVEEKPIPVPVPPTPIEPKNHPVMVRLKSLINEISEFEKSPTGEKLDHISKEVEDLNVQIQQIQEGDQNEWIKTFSSFVNLFTSTAVPALLKNEMEKYDALIRVEWNQESEKKATEWMNQLKTTLELQRNQLEADYRRKGRKAFITEEKRERLKQLEVLELKFEEAWNKLASIESRQRQTEMFIQCSSALGQIRVAIQTLKQGFSEPLEVLKKSGDSFISSVASTMGDSAKGINPIPKLVEEFRVLEKSVRQVSFVPQNATFRSLIVSRVLSWFTLSNVGGTDVESILARSKLCLSESNLDGAIREMNSLKGWPHAIASEWLEKTRESLSVTMAVQVLEDYLLLMQENQ